ncbi:MAG: DNA cytosine methyltransferase [Actinobacteria bacterium]|nr:DNA cytosine methyltransferase [Actinomycetota bacterium]
MQNHDPENFDAITLPDRPEATDRPLRALDLFAGAGGLSRGFEWAGAGDVVGAVEIDESAAETFRANHPGARVWTEDIRTVDPLAVEQELGPIDVVLGGPMCQGVSQRGPRDPRDERNFAFWAFADYVRKLKPQFFLMENVPAVASDVHNRRLAIAVFEELESLGYHLSAEVVCAAWFGVPQLRYRLVVLGSLDGQPAFPACVAAGIEGHMSEHDFVRVGDAIGDLPRVASGGGLDDRPMPRNPRSLSPYAAMLRGDAERLYNHWSADTAPVNLDRIRHVPEGGNWHDIPLELLPPRFREVRLSDHTTTYRRLDRKHPAHVITCLCGNVTAGAFTHPTQHRAITVREAARLQGFPDVHRFVGPRSSQYRQVGNAVPALMARRLAAALVGREENMAWDRSAAQTDIGWTGRVTLDVLKRYPDRRLPFTLAPRYKALFGARVHRRRQDLEPAAA